MLKHLFKNIFSFYYELYSIYILSTRKQTHDII